MNIQRQFFQTWSYYREVAYKILSSLETPIQISNGKQLRIFKGNFTLPCFNQNVSANAIPFQKTKWVKSKIFARSNNLRTTIGIKQLQSLEVTNHAQKMAKTSRKHDSNHNESRKSFPQFI